MSCKFEIFKDQSEGPIPYLLKWAWFIIYETKSNLSK